MPGGDGGTGYGVRNTVRGFGFRPPAAGTRTLGGGATVDLGPVGPAGPGQSPTPNGYSPTPFNNTAQDDPRLARLAGRIEDRLANPNQSTGRAIDLAVGRLRDLGEGQKRAGASSFARRGVMGSGVQAGYEAGVDEDVRAKGAGVAADLSLARERDEDAFMLGSAGALGAVGEANRADRRLALDQWMGENAMRLRAWETQEGARRSAEADRLARQSAVLNLLMGPGGDMFRGSTGGTTPTHTSYGFF